MAKKINVQESDALRTRVVNAKKLLKKKGKSKANFFDDTYGKMLKSESIKLDNLWATYTTDKDFTEKLEAYAK